MADEVVKNFNKSVVGNYYAICMAPSCGILLPVPIIAYQRGARHAEETAIIAQPDLTEVEEHFHTVHPGNAPLIELQDLPD